MFASFGNEPELSKDQFLVMQKFICHLYGHQDQDTNMVRYKMYSAKHGHLDPKPIPPCADSLRQHSLHTLYQVHIWRKSLESHPQILSPIDFGWDQNEDGHNVIAWNRVNPAPDEVLEMMFCTCERKCILGSCPFVDNSLKCTDACFSHDCENFQSEVEENCEYDEFSDDDDDDENDNGYGDDDQIDNEYDDFDV